MALCTKKGSPILFIVIKTGNITKCSIQIRAMASEQAGRRPRPSFLKPLDTGIADPAVTVTWASNLPH